MGEAIRVLQVFASLDRGGAETMLMNLYRTIDRSRIQFDFIVNYRDSGYAYEAEIKSLGGRIYSVPEFRIKNIIHFIKTWSALLREHSEWKIIHCHHTSCAVFYLPVIRRFHRTVIIHSHSASEDRSVKGLCTYLLRLPLRYQADYLFACSKAAAARMFGRNNKRVHILNNAINVERYEYKEDIRLEKRKELGLSDQFVIGHIGNFTPAKNYPFLLIIFREIHRINPKAVLMLVGKSENNPGIAETVSRLHLNASVIFTGVREDIPELLQAMDVFLFPSLYEGIPVSLIEAQASGLRCIISDTIARDVKITDCVEFLSLQEAPEFWSDSVLRYQNGYARQSRQEDICRAGYDIRDNVGWLEGFYQSVRDRKQ